MLKSFLLASGLALATVAYPAASQETQSPAVSEINKTRERIAALRDRLASGECAEAMSHWRAAATGDDQHQFAAMMAAQFSVEKAWGCFSDYDDRVLALTLIEANYFTSSLAMARPDALYRRLFGDNYVEVLAGAGHTPWMVRAAAIHLFCDDDLGKNPVLKGARVAKRVALDCEMAKGVARPEFARAWFWMTAAVNGDEWPVGLKTFPGFRSVVPYEARLAMEPAQADHAALREIFVEAEKARREASDREAADVVFAAKFHELIARTMISSRSALDRDGALEAAHRASLAFEPDAAPVISAIRAD